MEDKQIQSAEESIAIIEKMIEQAKKSVADNSFLFLSWGWLLFGALITQFMLKVIFRYPYHYYAWALMYLVLAFLLFYLKRKVAKRMTTTFIDRAIQYLLICLVISSLLLTLVFMRIGWENCYTFYMVIMAAGCFLAGKLLQYRPLVIASVLCAVMAMLSTYISFDGKILLCGFAVLVSYIIPGYLLRSAYRRGALNYGYKPDPNV
ncbi:MAG TPA: hypothetical protein VKQ52_13505 [Puia sp.]|nr:hypothetical protein [Puia sp.]